MEHLQKQVEELESRKAELTMKMSNLKEVCHTRTLATVSSTKLRWSMQLHCCFKAVSQGSCALQWILLSMVWQC